jgi:hypothetical protein
VDLQAVTSSLSSLQLQRQQEFASIAEWESSRLTRRVLNIYKGTGPLFAPAGSDEGFAVPGRLWVYDDGSCGFLLMDEFAGFELVELQRLDGDL